MSFTKEEARKQALYAAGKLAMAARMMLTATPLNMTSRADNLETCLDAYDRKILEMLEPHLEDK